VPEYAGLVTPVARPAPGSFAPELIAKAEALAGGRTSDI